jgi:hypothetical protein
MIEAAGNNNRKYHVKLVSCVSNFFKFYNPLIEGLKMKWTVESNDNEVLSISELQLETRFLNKLQIIISVSKLRKLRHR